MEETLKISQELAEEKKRHERNYFKETEKLLYAYPALKVQIEQVKLDIEDLKREGYSGRSKDIVIIPSGSQGVMDKSDIQQERIRRRIESLERTKREIARIEKALEYIKDDPGYPIIELKYFLEKDNEEIAEQTNCSVRTVIRHKNRLINKLKIYLFGADAL